MKPLVIYHANCMDGFGSAFSAWKKLGDSAEYVPASYNDSVYDSENTSLSIGDVSYNVCGRNIYVLDFSFSKEVTDELIRISGRFVWLDHHKTAFEMWGEEDSMEPGHFYEYTEKTGSSNVHIILDNNRSGALIAWEFFNVDDPVPMLIRHIDDRDRWQFKIEGSKEIHAALSALDLSFENMNRIIDKWNVHGKEFFHEGETLLFDHGRKVYSIVEQGKIECHIQSSFGNNLYYGGLAVNCNPHYASDVGHALANESGTFGLAWFLSKDGKCHCSLRSNRDYDVSIIAKSFGGGGHKNAAGFEIDLPELMRWLNITIVHGDPTDLFLSAVSMHTHDGMTPME